MKLTRLNRANLKNNIRFIRKNWQIFCLMILVFSAIYTFSKTTAQQNTVINQNPPTLFRIGERLTYNLSFGNFTDAGVAELSVVSRGKLSGKDAVEVQSRFKTTNFVSAIFYLIDEQRTTFAAVETGLPLYIRKTSNAGVLPQETINNFLTVPTANFDLPTLVYQARQFGGTGTYPFQEGEKFYTATFSKTTNEKFRNELGEFDTNISTVQSQYFTEKGITDVRINFTNDEDRIPVLMQFKTSRGTFYARIAAIQQPDKTVSPTPVLLQTPVSSNTPKPTITPQPYVNNQPLSADLPFKLGETLEYQITAAGKYLGIVTLQIKERKLFRTVDSLLLTATVTAAQPDQQILKLNDSIQTQINPVTLSPFDFNTRFTNLFNAYNQTVNFDQMNGKAQVNGTNLVDMPTGTHNLLSLAYAIRSFNLKPSNVIKNPVNDTRVAVLIGSTASVFVLKPSEAEAITINNEKNSAQAIQIATGNPQVDALNFQPRIWLSNDDSRVPLRLMLGSFQADLISKKIVQPQ